MMDGIRLDQLLVDRGTYETRARARDAIKRGCVAVDGKAVTKPGAMTASDAAIDLDDPAQPYVSRAALKLISALDRFDLDPVGQICVDIGASTGGFSQVLLERGAAKVFAVDVGHGQLAPQLDAHEQLVNLERLNARDLKPEHLGGEAPTFIVSDVSFISLKLALPPALSLADAGARCVLLVKPQFEVGRDKIGKNGLVDPAVATACSESMITWLDGLEGWQTIGLAPSPITGGDGNHEFLLAGVKNA
ncbi:MAG: TlyA family RNA methyltransferase [Pseudomonadota bacterium]